MAGYVCVYRIIDSGKQGSCEIHVRNAVRIRLNPGIFKVHIYKLYLAQLSQLSIFLSSVSAEM